MATLCLEYHILPMPKQKGGSRTDYNHNHNGSDFFGLHSDFYKEATEPEFLEKRVLEFFRLGGDYGLNGKEAIRLNNAPEEKAVSAAFNEYLRGKYGEDHTEHKGQIIKELEPTDITIDSPFYFNQYERESLGVITLEITWHFHSLIQPPITIVETYQCSFTYGSRMFGGNSFELAMAQATRRSNFDEWRERVNQEPN